VPGYINRGDSVSLAGASKTWIRPVRFDGPRPEVADPGDKGTSDRTLGITPESIMRPRRFAAPIFKMGLWVVT
jgi:hypothetical protein